MLQGKTLIIVLVALIFGFGAGFVLRPVIAPTREPIAVAAPIAAPTLAEPRGTQYFAAHLDEARRITDQCREGTTRGVECANADAAMIEAKGRERFRRFTDN